MNISDNCGDPRYCPSRSGASPGDAELGYRVGISGKMALKRSELCCSLRVSGGELGGGVDASRWFSIPGVRFPVPLPETFVSLTPQFPIFLPPTRPWTFAAGHYAQNCRGNESRYSRPKNRIISVFSIARR
jgi:hypothetical protein